MWLNNLFTDTSIDFEKRCRNRIVISAVLIGLGIVSLLLVGLMKSPVTVFRLEPESYEFVSGFYTGIGFGLIASGTISVVQNVRYLRNGDLRKQRQIYETDERNRMLGLRSWAYSGYAMFLFLYIGILVSGFINVTVMKTFLAVMAAYGVFLFVFRELLKRSM